MSENNLRREISTTAILVASAGGMIGSGWLFSSFYSAQIAGVGALISWVLAAIFMLFIALPLCELGTIYPISGGLSNYPKFTHGMHIGFIFSWLMWLSYVVMTPIEVQAVLQYASVFYPPLVHKNLNSVELTGQGYCFAVVLMILLVIVNNLGIRIIAECNKFISIFKFCVPLLAVCAFIYAAHSFKNLSSFNLSAAISWHNIFSALAVGGVAFAFTGFQNGLIIAGEVKNPQKNIPISILGAVLVGFCIYFLLQFAFIVAIPQEMLKDGFANLSFAGEAGPLVGLGLVLGLGIVVKLLLLDSVFSPLGTGLIYTTATSRILYGMAENGFLPKFILKLNKNKIPYITLLINLIIGLLVFFPFPSWQKMVAFLSSTSILSYCVGSICLLALRKQKPNIHRPFTMPWANLISYISFFVCNLMLYWCGWDIISKLYIAVIIGYIIAFISYKNKEQKQIFKLAFWFFAYISVLTLISYLGYFGGMKALSPVSDYVALFLLSVITLRWSTGVAVKFYRLVPQ
ncbi:MAG: APC family permease [Bdellovibrionota bacterium]